ncbi:MAG TPA: DUF885 domain-containing protein [Candidatus Acidoferrales bacterium]|nr:DUF885 domain-containing protein [Candidatus Acidoferrales bacterium]
MDKFIRAFLLLLAVLAISAYPNSIRARSPQNANATEKQAAWDKLADEYFDQVFFKFTPTAGTSAGLHQYDPLLEDYSRQGIDANIAALHAFEKRVEAVDATGLGEFRAADRELVLSNICGALLTLETIRPWEKNPDTYSGGISNSIYVIMIRKFAPPDDRLRSVIAREEKMPAVFTAARANLKNPPRIYTEIALEQLPGIVSFFQNDVPTAFATAADPALKAEFAKSNAAVIADLQTYADWLKSDLLPRSNGDFRIGADTFSKKLLYDEMVDTPLDRLLEIGWTNLRKNQAEFNRIAKELEPNKPASDVLAELAAMHPAPDKLLQSFRDTFDGLIAFIQTKHIITIPTDVRPILQETPPFMRATTFASMDTPGPFEKVAAEAYFNVTLPGPHDTPEEIEGRMASFNIGTIVSTSTHEAYPGHYIQFLWVDRAPTKVRMLLGASSNAEGWAHYCEQMMLDEGFGRPGTGAKDAREAKFIRLGQLQDALLRNARYIAGIEMHRGKMTFDQAAAFFVKEGFQSKQVGLVETKRGTGDPTYLYYTLGKLEILKLREDVMKKEGASFSLEQFHNNFMKQGFPPIKIVRQAMLGNNSPTL